MTTSEPTKLSLWKLLLWFCLWLVLLSIVLVLPWRWIPPPTSAFMLLEYWQTGTKPAYHWTGWDDINPNMAVAAVAAEDQKFPDHFGFDIESIRDAINTAGPRPRGASTISQQVSKNLFLWNGRSYVRKVIEAWLTVLIETLWPKRRILEVYLNIAEFAPGIYGVGAASALLYDKYPLDLSLDDCSILAAVLPNPKKMSASDPSAYVRKRAHDIQGQISQLGGTTYLDKL